MQMANDLGWRAPGALRGASPSAVHRAPCPAPRFPLSHPPWLSPGEAGGKAAPLERTKGVRGGSSSLKRSPAVSRAWMRGQLLWAERGQHPSPSAPWCQRFCPSLPYTPSLRSLGCPTNPSLPQDAARRATGSLSSPKGTPPPPQPACFKAEPFSEEPFGSYFTRLHLHSRPGLCYRDTSGSSL